MLINLKEHNKTDSWKFAIGIRNKWSDDCGTADYCLLHLALFKHSWWFRIPRLFKPKKIWVKSTYGLERKHLGGRGYWNYIPRDYGFSVDREALHLHYGIQPGVWSRNDKANSDHTKVYFIPWNETRRVRYQFYHPDGSTFYTVNEHKGTDWDKVRDIKEQVPKIVFKFNDCDGEEVTCTAFVEEMEWRWGNGWFKWVGWFRKPIIRRMMDLEFSKPVGWDKNHWKGGCTGHSVDMLPGETPLQSFTRYGNSEDKYRDVGIKNRCFTNIVIVNS